MSQPLQTKHESDVSMSGVTMASLSTSSVHTPGEKRKAAANLSQNPHTVKARKRSEAISQDPIRAKIEKAKAADQSAITVAKRKIVKSAEYINASPEEQQEMVKKSAADVRLKRYFFLLILY
jgi:hypothetical protein